MPPLLIYKGYHFTTEYMKKYCISVDWLQTYCLGNQLQPGTYTGKEFSFVVEKELHETPMFKDIYTVRVGNTEVATIQQSPRSSALNPFATTLKLSNRVLYSQRYIAMLYDMQESLSLTYKGITRIDICYDCNSFYGGRSVARFIKNYVGKPLGEVGSLYRRGSDKFSAHGAKSSTSDAKITSIRFGSPNSRIGAYIYDKTIELKEVKDKPWIRQVWEENGLVSDEKTHVWRAEISIKSEGTDMLNMSTGELFRMSPRYVEHAENIEKLFHIYAQKVFDFRICNGQKNKRNYDKLQIFEKNTEITSKPYYMNKSADTGRMEKICYNKLQKLSEQYSDLAEPRRVALISAMEFLQELSGKKSSIVRLQRYMHYLDELKGHEFIQDIDKVYFGAMEKLRLSKKEYDPEELYDCLISEPIAEIENDILLNELLYYAEY